MVVINLWGAPSSGKSTTAAGLFFLMKINKKRVELVTEFAKDLVWEGQEKVFGEQVYILGEQNHRLERLDGQVDFAITDSPLMLPVFYMPKGYMTSFPHLAHEQFHRYQNVNYLLHRTAEFEPIGRRHTEEQSEQIAGELKAFMLDQGIPFTEVEANPHTPQEIFNDIERRLPGKITMTLQPPPDQR